MNLFIAQRINSNTSASKEANKKHISTQTTISPRIEDKKSGENIENLGNKIGNNLDGGAKAPSLKRLIRQKSFHETKNIEEGQYKRTELRKERRKSGSKHDVSSSKD